MDGAMITVGASIDCCEYFLLKESIEALQGSGVNYLHVDIMDGKFVHNFGVGTSLLRCIADGTDLPLECHLMVENPPSSVDIIGAYPINRIIFHVEAAKSVSNALNIIRQIRNKGIAVGLAINIDTPISQIDCLIAHVGKIQLMSVRPGFVGQKFDELVLKKIEAVTAMNGFDPNVHIISVDGGIGYNEIQNVVAVGATSVIAGTTILFRHGESLAENARRVVAFCKRYSLASKEVALLRRGDES